METRHESLVLICRENLDSDKAVNRNCFLTTVVYIKHLVVKPGFHLQQTPRPRHKTQSDYVVEQSSFTLIALFWLEIGRCRGRNWP